MVSEATATVTARVKSALNAFNGKRNVSIGLQNTLCVPDLRINLVSVSKIVDNEHEVFFTQHAAYVRDSTGIVKVANQKGDLFYLRETTDAACVASTHFRNNAKLWHERLGHLNWRDMVSMTRSDTVSELEIDMDIEPFACETCYKGKMSSTPYSRRTAGSSELLGVVPTDLCGPIRTRCRTQKPMTHRPCPLHSHRIWVPA